ncbi:MAG: rRNA cytosine-C5-methyltransferase [Bacteroides sp.]
MNNVLPQDFVCSMRQLLGAEEYERFAAGMQCEPMVSVRLNPWRKAVSSFPLEAPVPWCTEGYYLKERPLFTLDPLFHAGAYYVQEASSMFLEQVMQRYVGDEAVAMLDLCAAPGGKSTHARALLPEGSLLVSNEVMKTRAQILAENLTKWGYPDVVVTRSDPADFAALEGAFDVLLTDVPCSGEGMFRKDEGAISDWSLENVELCRQRQQRILADVWPALKPGGLLIYSTCTYNIKEDEANVEWICCELGAEVLPVEVESAWGITGNLMPGSTLPVARFLPHRTKGEGLFMAALRKADAPVEYGGGRKGRRGASSSAADEKALGRLLNRQQQGQLRSWLQEEESRYALLPQGERVLAFPQRWLPLLQRLKEHLYLLQAGVALAEVKGRDLNPCHALAMSRLLRSGAFAEVEVGHEEALSYLRREVLQLPSDTPRGFVLITHQGVPLGFVKHLGTRANNLYPQEWRIRNL